MLDLRRRDGPAGLPLTPAPWQARPAAAVAVGVAALALCVILAAAGQPSSAAALHPYEHIATWSLPRVLPFAPLDVAIDNRGLLYVADAWANAVHRFDRSGRHVDSLYHQINESPLPQHAGIPFWVEVDEESGAVHLGWAGPGYGGSEIFSRFRVVERETLFPDGERRLWPGDEPGFNYFIDMAFSAGGARPPLRPRPNIARAQFDLLNASEWISLDIEYMGKHYVEPRRPGMPRIAFVHDNEIFLAMGQDERIHVYDSAGQLQRVLSLTNLDAIAPVADAAGQLYVLARGPEPEALVVELTSAGTQVGTTAFPAAPAPPATEWPWALTRREDGELAFTTAGSTFEVLRFDAAGQLVTRLYGGPRLDRYSFHRGIREAVAGSPVALAAGPGGTILAQDGRGGQVVSFDPDGRATVAIPGLAARDLAVDGSGHLFAVRSDQLIEARQWSADAWQPGPWRQPCLCPEGARLTASESHLFLGAPDLKSVRVLDSRSGAETTRWTFLEGGAGWPTDLAATDDGRLLTADLDRSEVQLWDATGSLQQAWTVGLSGGPRRVAVARIGGSLRVAVLTADGVVELYDAAGYLLSRWRPTVPGAPLYASDLWLDAGGRVFIADAAGGAVHVFQPAPLTPTPAASPTARPTDVRRSCTVDGDKRAGPPTVLLGESVAVTLTLRADCPGTTEYVGADLVLVVDRSGSMEGEPLRQAVAVGMELAHIFALSGQHRVGLVTFSDNAALAAPLGGSAGPVIEGLAPLVAAGRTNISAGLAVAAAHLREELRPDARPVVVLVSDGLPNLGDGRSEANALHAAGAVVATIGAGPDVDEDLLSSLASAPRYALLAPDDEALRALYESVLDAVFLNWAGDWLIDDQLGPHVLYRPFSARPAAVEGPAHLQWQRASLPREGITLTYSVLPVATGVIPVNRAAVAHYRDGDGVRRRFDFPIPEIRVISPTLTATPTATPTPTPTPTRSPQPLMLPLVLREKCDPTMQRNDVAIVLDASMSMGEQLRPGERKIDAARAAVEAFLDLLRLGDGDQAALIVFNSEATVLRELTASRQLLASGLGAVALAPGSRLDLGLAAGRAELLSARHRTGNGRVMVVLTDGRVSPVGPEAAVAEAALAKQAAITIFAIGLGHGENLDAWALRQIASRPEYYHETPDAAELRAIYAAIARMIPCPATAFWGRR